MSSIERGGRWTASSRPYTCTFSMRSPSSAREPRRREPRAATSLEIACPTSKVMPAPLESTSSRKCSGWLRQAPPQVLEADAHAALGAVVHQLAEQVARAVKRSCGGVVGQREVDGEVVAAGLGDVADSRLHQGQRPARLIVLDVGELEGPEREVEAHLELGEIAARRPGRAASRPAREGRRCGARRCGTRCPGSSYGPHEQLDRRRRCRAACCIWPSRGLMRLHDKRCIVQESTVRNCHRLTHSRR